MNQFQEIFPPNYYREKKKRKSRAESDEYYVIDLCDEVLGRKASRQHRFDFLTGNTGRKLPVDAYYEDLKLVVEYYERHHFEPIPYWDQKLTASGITRQEQRKIYDERRKIVLPLYGIKLVVINYFDFGASKRIIRNKAYDIIIVRNKLKDFVPHTMHRKHRKKRGGKQPLSDDIYKIISDYNRSMTLTEIAEQFNSNVSEMQIHDIVMNNSLFSLKSSKKGWIVGIIQKTNNQIIEVCNNSKNAHSCLESLDIPSATTIKKSTLIILCCVFLLLLLYGLTN